MNAAHETRSPTIFLELATALPYFFGSLKRNDLLEAKHEIVYGFTYTRMLGLFFSLLVEA